MDRSWMSTSFFAAASKVLGCTKAPRAGWLMAEHSTSADSCGLPDAQPVIWLMKIELMMAINQYPKLP